MLKMTTKVYQANTKIKYTKEKLMIKAQTRKVTKNMTIQTKTQKLKLRQKKQTHTNTQI